MANFGLYWLQRPNLNSLSRAPMYKGFHLLIWFGYYKWFSRSFKYSAFTDKPKSTRNYLFDFLKLGIIFRGTNNSFSQVHTWPEHGISSFGIQKWVQGISLYSLLYFIYVFTVSDSKITWDYVVKVAHLCPFMSTVVSQIRFSLF